MIIFAAVEMSREQKTTNISAKPVLVDSLHFNCVRCSWNNVRYLYDSTAYVYENAKRTKNTNTSLPMAETDVP